MKYEIDAYTLVVTKSDGTTITADPHFYPDGTLGTCSPSRLNRDPPKCWKRRMAAIARRARRDAGLRIVGRNSAYRQHADCEGAADLREAA